MKYKGRSYDKEYIELCKRILDEGVKDINPRPVYSDGSPAYSYGVFEHEIRLSKDVVPLLFSKKVGLKHAIEEMLWIWRDRSNVVKDLQDKGIRIWDEWELEDGTIGKCYGYQLARKVDNSGLNQVDNLIKNLKEDPESRRHITTLWDISSGHEMALKPCVYETQWVVLNNQLNLKVMIRSNDIALNTSAF